MDLYVFHIFISISLVHIIYSIVLSSGDFSSQLTPVFLGIRCAGYSSVGRPCYWYRAYYEYKTPGMADSMANNTVFKLQVKKMAVTK